MSFCGLSFDALTTRLTGALRSLAFAASGDSLARRQAESQTALAIRHNPEAATTLVEVAVSALVIVAFFVGIFEVNAVCLRYINASKENVTAIECVQDRLEQFRATDFASLTSTSAMTAVVTAPPNPSFLPTKATETVTISAFANGAATSPTVTYTRGPGTSVTPTRVPSGAIDFSNVTMVKVDITYSWNTTFNGRSRSETTSSVIAAGNKK